MNIVKQFAASLLTFSVLAGTPALATENLANELGVKHSNPEIVTDTNLADSEILLASRDPYIMIFNESTMDMAYRLAGTSYRLEPGMWQIHYFPYYGDSLREFIY